MQAGRRPRLLPLWHEIATREELPAQQRDALADPVSQWLMTYQIEQPKNVEFVMVATAHSQGAFLTSEPILNAMQLSGGEYEMVISAIRRETAAQAQQSIN